MYPFGSRETTESTRGLLKPESATTEISAARMHEEKRPDEEVIRLSGSVKAALEDLEYIEAVYNTDEWVKFAGNYIAVVDRICRGHGIDPNELRANVALKCNVPEERVAIAYIESPADGTL